MRASPEPALAKLLRVIETQGYKGYDPYDVLSSPAFGRVARTWTLGGRLAIQVFRLMPVNLRSALGIRPALDAKALGLLARGYFQLYVHTGEASYQDRGIECLRLLEDVVISGFAGACWAHPFPFVSSRGVLPANFPTVVSTVYAAHAFLDGYEQGGKKHWLEITRSVCDFILADLPRIGSSSERFCFSYYPGVRLPVHNASLLAVTLLTRVARLTGEDSLLGPAYAALRYTLDDQQPDGSWLYDGPESPSRSGSFVDGFHTGFILESLHSISSDTSIDLAEPLALGLRFYLDSLFAGSGQPLRKVGQMWPLDLRDCAQAIIVLAQLRGVEPRVETRLHQVIEWTIRNMQAKSGYFYYLRWKSFAIPIAYMRFQAWMLLALAHCYGKAVL